MRHSEWTDYLTPEEFAQYRKEMDNRRWAVDCLKRHDDKIREFETIAKARRARRAKETAE